MPKDDFFSQILYRLTSFKLVQQLIRHPRLGGLFVFIFLQATGIFLAWQNYHILTKKEESDSLEILQIVDQRMEQVMKQCYGALVTLAFAVDEQGVPHDFEKVAAKVMETSDVISVLELVPGGVIKYIYPLEGNESAMNYDIMADPTRSTDAQRAIDRGGVYFAGPLELKQGGTAIIGRLPIFQKDFFWGFSAVIIAVDDLLEDIGLTDPYMDQFYLQLSKINPLTGEEEFFLPQDAQYPLIYSSSVEFPDGDWRFYLTRKKHDYFSVGIILLFSFALSVFAGLMVVHLLREPDRLHALVKEKSGELSESERKFRLLFEQASDGIALFDRGGRFLEANPKMEELCGYSLAELRELRNFELVYESDENFYNNLIEKLDSGNRLVYERQLLRKDGTILPIEISAAKLPGGNFQGIVRDISDRKRNEELLKAAEEKFYNDVIVAVEEEKHKFGQELHDGLGQLLSAISMHVNMLSDDTDLEREDSQYIGSKIRELSDKAIVEARAISHGLMSSSIRQNGLIISIHEIGHQFQSSSQIDVDVVVENVDEKDLTEVMKLNLYRIAQELANNTVKHAKATAMSILLKKEANVLILEIKDNGVGFEETKKRGVGLGNVCYRTKLIKGDLDVSSEPGRGTHFTVRVPLL